MSTKRESREFLLQFLYHFQLPAFQGDKVAFAAEVDSVEVFARMQEFKQTLNIDLNTEQQAYVATIVKGIFKHYAHIEETLVKYLKNWKLSRISKIEHTILVMSIYELMYHPETSGKLVINEAIELGKKYSTKDSSSFINGVLDSVFKQEVKTSV